jgi:cohesin complex subunit SA-1/2
VEQHLEAETKKGQSARMIQLKTQVELLNDKSRILDDKLSSLYDVVFTHRYRDVDANIRQECIRELGKWIYKVI